MKAGKLRHRVTFLRASEVANEFGEMVPTWVPLLTTWARVAPLAGKERYAAMQQQFEADHVIECRYQAALSDLGPPDRAEWRGQTLDIKSAVDTEGRRVQLEIYARKHG